MSVHRTVPGLLARAQSKASVGRLLQFEIDTNASYRYKNVIARCCDREARSDLGKEAETRHARYVERVCPTYEGVKQRDLIGAKSESCAGTSIDIDIDAEIEIETVEDISAHTEAARITTTVVRKSEDDVGTNV